MFRKIENANNKQITQLIQKIHLGVISMMHDYAFLYSLEEMALLNKVSQIISKIIQGGGYISVDEIYKVLEFEDYLKPFVFRCWDFETKKEENKSEFISWFKTDTLKDMPSVLSATFSSDVNNTFCQARYGIRYEVFIDGFLGACNKDAATLVENQSKVSIYTIGITEDNKVINSYNFATPIITPVQVFAQDSNSYRSKHNEVILDARYVKPISVVYMDDHDLEMVNLISKKYNIPIEMRNTKTI